jgi:hypothetical protein
VDSDEGCFFWSIPFNVSWGFFLCRWWFDSYPVLFCEQMTVATTRRWLGEDAVLSASLVSVLPKDGARASLAVPELAIACSFWASRALPELPVAETETTTKLPVAKTERRRNVHFMVRLVCSPLWPRSRWNVVVATARGEQWKPNH